MFKKVILNTTVELFKIPKHCKNIRSIVNGKMTESKVGVPAKMRENPAIKKIDTPEFRKIFTEELKTLVGIFDRHGHEIRIAGGAVRDILMHIDPKDIDFATTATPQQMKDMFTKENVRMINANGEKHGTITARILDKSNFEVTTLRIDVLTDGRHAKVQFTTDWQLDANRRDLTINSMFLGLDGTLYDYFYGYDDLQKRRVVFVGDAKVRIREDYLRILRYFRFYGRIANEPNMHDSDTIKAIRENGDGLANISGERIWSELQKILVGNFVYDLMLEMISCGLAPHCGLPVQPNVVEFQRLCNALQQLKEPHQPILFMIALLHTPEDALKLHARLKLSVYERDLAFFITHQRDMNYIDMHSLQEAIILKNQNRQFLIQLLKYSNKLELFEMLKNWRQPHFPVNGELLVRFGCKEKIKFGLIMQRLKKRWLDSNFKLTADEMLTNELPEVLEEVKHTEPNTKRKRN